MSIHLINSTNILLHLFLVHVFQQDKSIIFILAFFPTPLLALCQYRLKGFIINGDVSGLGLWRGAEVRFEVESVALWWTGQFSGLDLDGIFTKT